MCFYLNRGNRGRVEPTVQQKGGIIVILVITVCCHHFECVVMKILDPCGAWAPSLVTIKVDSFFLFFFI